MAYEQNPWDINYINKPDNTSYLPPATSVAPVASASPSVATKPVSTITTEGGESSLNKDLNKLNTYTSAQYDADLAKEKEPKVSIASYKMTDEQEKRAGQATSWAERQKIEDEGAYTAEQLVEMGITDVSNFTKTSSGKFKPTAEAYAQMGLTGVQDSKASELDTELENWNTELENKVKEINSFNVDTDPVFKAQADSIRSQYAILMDEMRQINEQRKQAYDSLGYKSGTTELAGSTQMGLMGAELNQATKRLAEIATKESEAISSARLAFQKGKYEEFGRQVDNLEIIRDAKSEELKNYNQKLKDESDKIREDAKLELEKLKYEQSLKSTEEKEYNLAKSTGFEGSYMDYLTAKEEIKVQNPNMPSSYTEWMLAGGEAGTGKSYAEFIAKSTSQGPASYQEWSLAGGQAGTGKTYAEWVGGGLGNGMDDKQKAIFNSIVNKYSTSPLIAAQDRTIVLKNIVEQIKQNPNDGALQLGLVYSYVQALDTYQSAVREGELGLVNSIDSKYGQLKNSVEKIQNGQIVRGEVAQQIADAAQVLVDTIAQGAANKEKMFKSQARVNGIENSWDDFVSGFKDTGVIDYKQKIQEKIENGEIDDRQLQQVIDDWNNQEYDWNDEDLYNFFYPKQEGFNKEGSVSANAQKIAMAIKQVESGGNYNAKGGSGESGAYQYMPQVWKEWAGKYLGNQNAPMTQANQDKVAQAKINDLLKQGYNAQQIALIWNGGSPTIKSGTNKYGVKYDTGAYATKVLNALNNLS